MQTEEEEEEEEEEGKERYIDLCVVPILNCESLVGR